MYYTAFSDHYVLSYVAFDALEPAQAHHDFLLKFGGPFPIGVYCSATQQIVYEPPYKSESTRRALLKCVAQSKNQQTITLDR